MLARLLGFMLGNRGGLVPKNRFYLSKECMFTAQGPLGNRGGLAPKIDST